MRVGQIVLLCLGKILSPCASELYRILHAEFNRLTPLIKRRCSTETALLQLALGTVNTACAQKEHEAALNLTQAVWFKFYFAAAGYPYSKSDAHCIDEISPSCFSYAVY